MNLLVRIVLNALALYAVARLVPGVAVTGPAGALVAAVVLGVVNAVLRPILVLLALPLELLTLGLFTLVINGALFALVGALHVGLEVRGFGAAFVGALVLGIASWALSLLLAPGARRVAR